MGKVLITYRIPADLFEDLLPGIDAVHGRYFIMEGISYQYVTYIGEENNKHLKEFALKKNVDITEFDLNRQLGSSS